MKWKSEKLISEHGGYRNLKSFQISRLVYDSTVRFCDKYIDRFSRTKDQMVQAARSGVQNIAEGSQASATSKKSELKLTNVARASLEELKLDYEDFLRQKNMELMNPEHPVLLRFKQNRCKTLEEVRNWVKEEREISLKDRHRSSRTNTNSKKQVSASARQYMSVYFSSELVANAALSLLNLACYLLDRQINRLAEDFEQNGGFTEKLYRIRTAKKKGNCSFQEMNIKNESKYTENWKNR